MHVGVLSLPLLGAAVSLGVDGVMGGVHMIAYCRRLLSANRCFFFFPFFRQKLLKG